MVDEVVIGDPHGLHAALARRMADLVEGSGCDVRLHRSADPQNAADAARLLDVLGLGLGAGETVQVTCSGPAAEGVLAEVVALLGATPPGTSGT